MRVRPRAAHRVQETTIKSQNRTIGSTPFGTKGVDVVRDTRTHRGDAAPASLPAILQRALHDARPAALCVAFSGGPDSTALLHALAQLPEARACGLRAIHIDHGLHPDSARWAEHCRAFCRSLAVPLATARIDVRDRHGEGTEAAARRSRYAAFAKRLRDGEWLALAHHRDDQIETILLKLLRGAGPEGLGGMRALRSFPPGLLWRPLLEVPREILRMYLSGIDINWIEDPANADRHYARNVLRHDVLPAITRHWPHAGRAILHSAALCRIAAGFIDEKAAAALASNRRDAKTLDVAGWRTLPDALRAPTLDAWLHDRGLPAPADASRRTLERQAASARSDRVPMITWPGAEIRIWDRRLYALSPLAPLPKGWHAQWGGAPLALPPDCGTLALEPILADRRRPENLRFDPPLLVRFRCGGERIRPAGDPHTRELRNLFQQARVPPWIRSRCPLIFEQGVLIAVADLWCSKRGQSLFAQSRAKPVWVRPGSS